jgi:hypothetical protein
LGAGFASSLATGAAFVSGGGGFDVRIGVQLAMATQPVATNAGRRRLITFMTKDSLRDQPLDNGGAAPSLRPTRKVALQMAAVQRCPLSGR